MIFLAIMPFSAAFFNFVVPLQIGARDVAFPRLNAFSYWTFLAGGILLNMSWFFNAAPDQGWYGYAPLTEKAWNPGRNVDFWMFGLQVLGVASVAAGINFIVTIFNLRAPGMTMMRMPIFTWSVLIVQILIVMAFPAITIALVLLAMDRFAGTGFYAIAAGGDRLLWQHLFWVFGHPEVYILVLPAFGIVSEIHAGLFPQAALRLLSHGLCPRRDRLPRLRRVGAPHVHHRPRPDRQRGFRRLDDADRDPDRGEDLQLDRHDGARIAQIHDANALCRRAGLPIHDRRAFGRHACLAAGRHPAQRHLLRRSPTSTTCSLAAAIFGLLAGAYYWFPKMTGRMMDDRSAR